MGPNTAFCLVIFGVLGIYCEFIWPGRVWQGVLGGAAAATGGYFLWAASPSHSGLALLAVAAGLFLLGALVETFCVAGAAATVVMALGVIRLIAGARGIRPILAIPWCVAFGVITVGLNWAGRRARRNKRADLV